MSRFRPLSMIVDADADADVRALMEDIDASLGDLEKRLEAEQASARTTPATSVVDRVAPIPGNAELPPVDAEEPVPMEASGFLADLAHEAAVMQGAAGGDAAERELRDRRLHDTMGRIFQFFSAFCRHANILAPDVRRPYRLDTQIAYAGLKWQEASVRYRLQSLREKALMDYVTLTVRLAAPEPVPVVRRWDQMEQLRKEMHILDLRPAEGMDLDAKPEKENVHIALAADFPVQVTFRANYRKGRVDLLTRNLNDFGIAAFVCEAADINQQLLDDLGRFLLDRIDKLPPGLQPVHLRSQL